ncbi:ABC transporter permease [Curvibacter sp. CHRR-16]|uniref:ABC transporter permease n=1 Tax=Curvibacter sp. CHRR-16 TaxID=2835872 RepID=UPI001BDA70CC|nr:ABC transporter permease [Curvibacter sp. CHRR-16]MBT0571339.1 ABC transporter permease [Curvibacter sp. CHRR-16]
MQTWILAWRYWWSRPLSAVLNLVLLSLGLASMAFVLMTINQIDQAFKRDLHGIDAVVGAKGSPMQLILSGVLHIDIPPGNIPLKALSTLRSNPQVQQVIPISLGDNFRGFRIVGTSTDYAQLYGVELQEGQLWTGPMQAVIGAAVAKTVGMKLGDRFVGSHGLGMGGHVHGEFPYDIVGVLKPTGGVVDRLILTDTASVWKVHEAATANDADDLKVLQEEREVTMALVRYNTPLAAVTFPRWVNAQTDMQAAAPAFEITRLLHMMGLGTDVLQGFAIVMLATAGMSVFIALWSAVRERQADLALLRMLGASPAQLAGLLLAEAVWLAMLAAALGLLLGQGGAWLLAHQMALDQTLLIAGLAWLSTLWLVPVVALAVALLAALLPVWSVYRISVLQQLQRS